MPVTFVLYLSKPSWEPRPLFSLAPWHQEANDERDLGPDMTGHGAAVSDRVHALGP